MHSMSLKTPVKRDFLQFFYVIRRNARVNLLQVKSYGLPKMKVSLILEKQGIEPILFCQRLAELII